MPDREQTVRLIESAWRNFCCISEKAGLKVDDDSMNGLIKDVFLAGYSFGHKDTLNIIRGQLEAEYIVNKIMDD